MAFFSSWRKHEVEIEGRTPERDRFRCGLRRRYVTVVTVNSTTDCDDNHSLPCDAALLRCRGQPTIGGMGTASTSPLISESPEPGAVLASGKPSAGLGAATRPLQVTWEMTGACEWRISPSRLSRLQRDKRELSTAEAFNMIQDVAEMHVPLLVLTGGDPLLRPDVFPIVEFASQRSVRVSMTVVPTPLLTEAAIADLKAAGLMRIAFWLHGSTGSLHDACSGSAGSHKRTLEMIGACHEVQLPVQVCTMVSRRNFHELDPLIELLTRLDVVLWNVFFLVPPDRDHSEDLLSAAEHEEVFAKLYAASKRVQFQIKTSEGQHYQRFLLEQRVRESHGRARKSEVMMRANRGVNDSRGLVFINRVGEVYPSRYLPVSAGNMMQESLSEVFRNSDLFASLRDTSRLKGKCGHCPVRTVCGGSRARAYALTGDLFAEEPCCAYEP